MNFFKPKFWDKNKISFFSVVLFPISLLIKLLIFFKRYLTKTNQSSIPIICVGNIYLGGTGKTPYPSPQLQPDTLGLRRLQLLPESLL